MPKANNSYLKKEDYADIMQISFQLKLSQNTQEESSKIQQLL